MTALHPFGADHGATRVKIGHSFHAEAIAAIEAMGPSADIRIVTGSTMYFGAWLGWPDWLREGTSLTCSGPLPKAMTVRDDLIIIANILEHQGEQKILGRVLFDVRQPVGPLASLALANAPSLGEALVVMARLTNVLRPYFHASVISEGTTTRLRLERQLPPSRLADMIALTILFVSYRLVASYVGEFENRVALHCGLSREFIDSVNDQIACLVAPGAAETFIELPCEWMSFRNELADASLWGLALEQIAQAERQLRDSDFVGSLRRRIAAALINENRVPRLKEVAKEEFSQRSLARLLAASGTSFHAIVDEERRLRAISLINDRSLSLQDVAAQLGFNDVSSFGRSFRAWFGVSPGRFRNGERSKSR